MQYVNSFITSLSIKGQDRLQAYILTLEEAGLGYYFETESLVANIKTYGTPADQQWLASQTASIEYLAALNDGTIGGNGSVGTASTEEEVLTSSNNYLAILGTSVHQVIANYFKNSPQINPFGNYSESFYAIPNAPLKPDLVYDDGRDTNGKDVLNSTGGDARIFEVKPISNSLQKNPGANFNATAQLGRYVNAYKSYFKNKTVSKGTSAFWNVQNRVIPVPAMNRIIILYQFSNQPGMIYYRLFDSKKQVEDTSGMEVFSPVYGPAVSLSYNGQQVQGKVVVRQKNKNGTLGNVVVVTALVGGATVVVLATLIDDVSVVGVADDAVGFAIAGRMLQTAITRLAL